MSERRGQVGRTRDAGWQIGVSKTVDHPVERARAPGTTGQWLAPSSREIVRGVEGGGLPAASWPTVQSDWRPLPRCEP